MLTRNCLSLLLITSITIECAPIRNINSYGFIQYNPNRIRYSGVLTANNFGKLFPSVSNAFDVIVENKKYSVPVFAALFTGILAKFVPKFLGNLIPFRRNNTSSAAAQLNTYRCTKCNYTIYPAQNRDSKFVNQKFTCPSCNSPFSAFVATKCG